MDRYQALIPLMWISSKLISLEHKEYTVLRENYVSIWQF